jgi:hypothetical protein
MALGEPIMGFDFSWNLQVKIIMTRENINSMYKSPVAGRIKRIRKDEKKPI